jgi:hypothetical protein
VVVPGDHVHWPRVESAGGEQGCQSDGAGPDDRDTRTGRQARPTNGVDTDGERLDEGSLFGGHTGREGKQAGDAPLEDFGETASPAGHCRSPGTVKELAGLAEWALTASPTETNRLDRDQVARSHGSTIVGGQTKDLAGDFVAVGQVLGCVALVVRV